MQSGPFKLALLGCVCAALLAVSPTAAQDDPSHRKLQRPGSGMLDLRSLQKRLELMQHLQRFAKLREDKGLPPLDFSKLSPETKKQLKDVLKQDQDQRKRLDALKRMLSQQPLRGDRSNPPAVPREGQSTQRPQSGTPRTRPQQPRSSQRNEFTPDTPPSSSRNGFNRNSGRTNRPAAAPSTPPPKSNGNTDLSNLWPFRNSKSRSTKASTPSANRTNRQTPANQGQGASNSGTATPSDRTLPPDTEPEPRRRTAPANPNSPRGIPPRTSDRKPSEPLAGETGKTPSENKPKSTSYFRKLREFSERNAYKKPKKNSDEDLISQIPPDFFKQLEDLDQSLIREELNRQMNSPRSGSRRQNWPDTQSQRDLVDDAAGNFDMVSRWAREMGVEGLDAQPSPNGNRNGSSRDRTDRTTNNRNGGRSSTDGGSTGDLNDLFNGERWATGSGSTRTANRSRSSSNRGGLSNRGGSQRSTRPGGNSSGGRDGSNPKSFKDLLKNIKKTAKDAAKRSPNTNSNGNDRSGSRGSASPQGSNGSNSSSSGASSSSSWKNAARRAAENMSEDVITDLVKSAQKGRSRPPQTQSSSSWKPRGPSKSQKFFDSLFDSGRKVSNYLDGGSTPTPSGGGGFGGPGNISLPNAPSASAFLPILIGIAVIGLLWFMLRTSSAPQPAAVAVGAIEARMPMTINTRQDVIEAFHAIAARSPAVRGNWWTHSRVGRALRKLMPSRDDAVGRLTDIYETARYLPPNEELTPDQLQVAREVIQQCGK